MISRRPSSFDVIARILAERLRGCEPSEELRAIVYNRGVDWEHLVGYASGDLVLPAFAAAATDLGLSESLDRSSARFSMPCARPTPSATTSFATSSR